MICRSVRVAINNGVYLAKFGPNPLFYAHRRSPSVYQPKAESVYLDNFLFSEPILYRSRIHITLHYMQGLLAQEINDIHGNEIARMKKHVNL